jgi:hypothetical protein
VRLTSGQATALILDDRHALRDWRCRE